MNILNCCRICKNTNLIDIINLGDHKLSSRFPRTIDEYIPSCPLILTKCSGVNVCNLVQLKHSMNPGDMYCNEYGYRSGINNTMTNHLYDISKYINDKYSIQDNDVILDIGSNDATLLKSYLNYGKNIKLIGIDPTSEQFQEYYPENIIRVADYFTSSLYNSVSDLKAKFITSLSMFYDVPDPIDFMTNIKNILKEDGIWIMEQSYLPSMIKNFSFDTICHEHLEYYCLKQIKWMTDITGLKIVDVIFNECNGGSFRVFITHEENNCYDIDNNVISNILKIEEDLRVDDISYYSDFMIKCNHIKNSLMRFLRFQKECRKTICIYGASTKGNTLLQYFGIDNSLITCISERNNTKHGKYTPGSNIIICSEEEVRQLHPDFMLVLQWHFKEEFLDREREYLDRGGQFIFPLPYIDIISNYKKVLITGISGNIGTYLKNLLLDNNNVIVYGIVNNTIPTIVNRNLFYIKNNLLKKGIEDVISMLFNRGTNNEIYNLAGITDSRLSIEEPVLTFKLNSLLPIRICESILKVNRSIKLFQASSSEMYKGDLVRVVNENKQYNPVNPYGISKITACYTIDYYRSVYNLFCCYGIIFNTESPIRNIKFVTQKVCSKIKEYKNNIDNIYNIEPLEVGQINTHRDWIHSYDVCTAIIRIMNNTIPDNYIISLGKLHSIKDFINKSFKLALNIDLEWKSDGGYYNNILLVKINKSTDNSIDMITGNNSKLLSIGWRPVYTLEDIIMDMTIF